MFLIFSVVAIGLTNSSYSFGESEKQPQICASIVQNQLERDLVLALTFTSSTASPEDFNTQTQTLTFSEQNLMACANVTIEDDDFFENDESFTVRLNGNGNGPIVQFNDISEATVFIIDNDGNI